MQRVGACSLSRRRAQRLRIPGPSVSHCSDSSTICSSRASCRRSRLCYLVATAIFLWTRLARRGRAGIVGAELRLPRPDVFLSRPGLRRWAMDASRCNFAGYIDRIVLDGHLWGEALRRRIRTASAALLPAITSVLFGVLAGYMLRLEPRATHRALWMLASGCVAAVGRPRAVQLGSDQQTALDDVVRGADGRPVVRRNGVLDMGMRCAAMDPMAEAVRDLWHERYRGLRHIDSRQDTWRRFTSSARPRMTNCAWQVASPANASIDLRRSARPRRLRRRLVDVPAPLVPAHLKLSSRQAARPSGQRPEGPPRPRSLRRRPGSPLRPRSGARRRRAL